ncbi:hypothetical protein P7L66_03295 (plasmid) [Tistrella mobilis]|uniref:hypothetical protein n=1 Tax=Tistrella mobilis TaxID=171437 RepID=UPI003556B9E4
MEAYLYRSRIRQSQCWLSVVAPGSWLATPRAACRALALLLALDAEGIRGTGDGVALDLRAGPGNVLKALCRIADAPPPDPLILAQRIGNKIQNKFDHLLDDDLLAVDAAAARLETAALPGIARSIVQALSGSPGSGAALHPD